MKLDTGKWKLAHMVIGVIIAAGGIGRRMQAGGSKQLLSLMGKPVLAHTVSLFEELDMVSEIVIAIDPGDVARCRREVVEQFGLSKVTAVVPGGESRAESVGKALAAISTSIDVVLVHDGARPLLSADLLRRGLRDFDDGSCDGVVFGLPVTDTIKEVGINSRLVTRTPDRSRFWAAQTPQIFKRDILEKAYSAAPDALAQATDDASLVERIGGWVRMVPGSRENIKLTDPFDLQLAETILRNREESTEVTT
ncbi:MAG: 2-C-methyl-D-erythritol 4-phosphate cytidylyltransferase [Thermoleophilia bacterium]